MTLGQITTDVERAARMLRQGGLVALPTETVYGLAARTDDQDAVRRVYQVKQRPLSHPLIVHLASIESFELWLRSPAPYTHRLIEAFCPGPLTLVGQRTSLASDIVTAQQDSVAVRVPDHPQTREVLTIAGVAAVAPSANPFGRISPTTAKHVQSMLGNKVDCILDGGEATVGVESTIVDVRAERPAILRPGKITAQMLEQVIGCKVLESAPSKTRVPGQAASHYAPSTPLQTVESEQLAQLLAQLDPERTIALHWSSVPTWKGLSQRLPEDLEQYARVLYAALHDADRSPAQRIVIELPPMRGIGIALRDRLSRAAVRNKA